LGSDFVLLRFDPKVEVGGRVAAAARPSVGRLSSARNNNAKAAEEVADVVIVLCRLMTRMGRNLGEEVPRKIAINRTRQWNLTADGHGYHVRDKITPSGKPE
jgi:hypothetical protein